MDEGGNKKFSGNIFLPFQTCNPNFMSRPLAPSGKAVGIIPSFHIEFLRHTRTPRVEIHEPATGICRHTAWFFPNDSHCDSSSKDKPSLPVSCRWLLDEVALVESKLNILRTSLSNTLASLGHFSEWGQFLSRSLFWNYTQHRNRSKLLMGSRQLSNHIR